MTAEKLDTAAKALLEEMLYTGIDVQHLCRFVGGVAGEPVPPDAAMNLARKWARAVIEVAS